MYNHRKTTLTTAVDNCCCRCMIRTDLDSCTYMCSKCAPSATRLLVNTGSRQLSINIQITSSSSSSSSSVSSPSYVVTCEEDDRKRLHVACRRCVSQGGFDQGGLGLRCITREQLTNVWSTSSPCRQATSRLSLLWLNTPIRSASFQLVSVSSNT